VVHAVGLQDLPSHVRRSGLIVRVFGPGGTVLTAQGIPASQRMVGQRVFALPTPGKVPDQDVTVSADRDAFDHAQFARNYPTPDVRMSQALLAGLRRMNITAAPPAHIKPSVWSEPIDLSASVALAAAVTPFQTVISFRNPPGRMSRITHYGVNVTNPAYTYDGTILWGWRYNGRLIDQGLTNWGEQRGSMVFLRPTVIIMKDEGALLEFLVRRPAAAGPAYTVQMCMRGWTWRLRNNYVGTQASVTAY